MASQVQQKPSSLSDQTSGCWNSPQISRQTFESRFFSPIDIASLVFFRIVFGAIMLWEVWRYFHYDRIYRYYVDPTFFFSYYGFEWVKPWPGNGMYWHFWALGILAFCIMVGLCYRLSAILFFVAFLYVFLLDQTEYLNHFYLIVLISGLLIFLPAHRAFSVDSRLHPDIVTDTVPAWTLWLLRTQIGIVYFYGGLAKLNGDWLRGEPMRMWLAEHTDFPLIGAYFIQEWMVYAFAYGGLLLDLLVVPFLLWRRTRLLAFILVLAFHLLNSQLFSIGIFPWFMIAATMLFLTPPWPRHWLRWRPQIDAGCQKVASENMSRADSAEQAEEVADDTPTIPQHPKAGKLEPRTRQTMAVLAIYLALQLLIPLRHWLYPGDPSWTEEGHHFSWHMMLRAKSGSTRFFATDPVTKATWEIDQRKYLTSRQMKKMRGRPDMILQFAHHVALQPHTRGQGLMEVRVRSLISLNGRRPQLLIDPTVNLAAQPRTLGHSPWIIPLQEPLFR